MKTLKINFTDATNSTKEVVPFGTNNTEFAVQVLTNPDDDLIIEGAVNFVNELRNIDIDRSLFADELNEKDIGELRVKYFSFQVNNNVDKQQLIKLTMRSTSHSATHSFYFSSPVTNT